MNWTFSHVEVGYVAERPMLRVDHAELAPGKLHVLLGPNGSGKTTLLRTMLGLQPMLAGELRTPNGHLMTPSTSGFSGIVSRRQSGTILTSRRRSDESSRGGRALLGASTQAIQGGLWTASDVAFVASTPPKEVGLTVHEVLSLSGEVQEAIALHPSMVHWLDTPLHRLSDGQKQQVMLARAALQSRAWIVMDEPTAFLDVSAQMTFWDMLTKLVQEGRGVVMATHDLLGISRWSERQSRGAAPALHVHGLVRGTMELVAQPWTLDSLESKVVNWSNAPFGNSR
ncbi:MAG: ABC transporter ATP-binding protein [Bacteroidetes bacterium]|nr:ABC transporter ATP-binding protein [Bacteroidota bacterium]MDA0902805.1 ABC transporter ATP-binding protein [Bacteroidota bacterium]MDA1242042.1 ABC transporter ATP-binding protein [Bacteroidota bacterium]